MRRAFLAGLVFSGLVAALCTAWLHAFPPPPGQQWPELEPVERAWAAAAGLELGPVPDALLLLTIGLRSATGREIPLVHPAIVPSSRRFLKAYRAYTGRVTVPLRKALGPAAVRADAVLSAGQASITTAAPFGTFQPVAVKPLTALRRRLTAPHRGLYYRAMAAADEHLKDFSARLAPAVRGRRTYLIVHKSECLAFLVGEERNEVLAMFPIGIGLLPGQKVRAGDRRSPEGLPDGLTRETTPFFVGMLIPNDPYPTAGVITRGIGVASRHPRFWVLGSGWLIMFHGTPDAGSMGTPSSLGCFRMLPRHIELLFAHVTPEAPIVIVP